MSNNQLIEEILEDTNETSLQAKFDICSKRDQLSIEAFCEKFNVSLSNFNFWLKNEMIKLSDTEIHKSESAVQNYLKSRTVGILPNKSFSKIISRKTRRGNIVRIIREHYLRSDFSCQVEKCSLCSNFIGAQKIGIERLSSEASHFIIPDLQFTIHFIELLECIEITDVIFLKTILNEIQTLGYTRLLKRIRNLVIDSRKRCVIFTNEHFTETFIERDSNESIQARNERAISVACNWYYEHLQRSPNLKKIPLVVISNQESLRSLISQSSKNCISSLSFQDYINTWWKSKKKSKIVVGLFDSLLQVYQESLESKESKEDQKKTEFELFLNEEEIEIRIKSGSLFKGKFSVSSNNTQEGTVSIPYSYGYAGDIFIPDIKSRNRTIHGDLVAVQLLPESEWKCPSSSLKQTNEEDENFKDENSQSSPQEQEKKKHPTGKIVGVIERVNKSYVATIQIDKDCSAEEMKTKEKVLCVPLDPKIPKIRIKTRQTSALLNSRIVVRIDSWDATSKYPFGHYITQLGELGKLETETQTILVDNGIIINPFSSAMLSEIPSTSVENPWQLPEEEIKKRRDLRKECIFSIDPLGSEDIDDALSAKILPSGNIQIGCHIADVTYFLQKDSLLDTEAKARGTTVYLAETRFDMLPGILSTDLASLREQKDRPAVSVIWELNSQLEIVKAWYGRTAIRSCHELYYELAQRIADDKMTEEEKKKYPDHPQLKEAILLLIKVARKFREERIREGALELESQELRFVLNQNTKSPEKIVAKKSQEINNVVAEFMILANKHVAKKIYDHYPSAALLRNHPPPRPGRFDRLNKLAASKGFTLDTRSNYTLAKSLDAAVIPEDPTFNQVLRTLATQCVESAEYISTGSHTVEEFYHFGLAANFYTHFTSPIRRYADVVVHRQLLQALKTPPEEPLWTDQELSELAAHINTQHDAAKNAQRDSSELFQTLFFKNRNDHEDAVIYDIRTNGLLIFLPKYGIRGTVYLRGKDGTILIPPTAFPSKKSNSPVTVSNYTIDEDFTTVSIQTSKGLKTLHLFDHFIVKILVQESRAHRSTLKFELVQFTETKIKSTFSLTSSNIKFKEQDMIQAIKAKEKAERELSSRIPRSSLADYKTYADSRYSTNSVPTLYLSLETSSDSDPTLEEKFQNLSLSSKKDQTIRIWKDWKQYQKKKESMMLAQSLSEVDEDESGDFSGSESGDFFSGSESRKKEIEERNRERLPIEQKFRGEITKMEQSFKMRTKKKN